MWKATVDFKKAFDSIRHKSIWNALKSCGIEHDYSFLKKLFRDQKASALTDEESNIFCQACFSTWFYRKHWKTTFRAGNREKEWEFT